MPAHLKPPKAIAALSLTPLIDVVFLLLIFFLVASRFAMEEHELPVELPTASSAVPMMQRPRELVIDVDISGKIFIDGQPRSAEQLDEVLQRAVASNPTNQTVVIRADRRTEFQAVVVAMDACNRSGIADYVVVTRQQENS
jgi:biopolymer transport protein ExbD